LLIVLLWGVPQGSVTSLAAGAKTLHFRVGDTDAQVYERVEHLDIWPTTSVLLVAVVLVHGQPLA